MEKTFEDYNEYFKRQWMSQVGEWNVAEVEMRTNNNLERYNRVIKQEIPRSPGGYSFAAALQRLSESAYRKMLNDEVYQRKCKDQSTLKDVLPAATEYLLSGKYSVLEFLTKIAQRNRLDE